MLVGIVLVRIGHKTPLLVTRDLAALPLAADTTGKPPCPKDARLSMRIRPRSE